MKSSCVLVCIDIVEFARGNVLLDIGGHKYEAVVLVGYTTMQEMVLYDVQDFTSSDFTVKEKKAQPTLAGNESDTRKTVVPSNNILPQDGLMSSETGGPLLPDNDIAPVREIKPSLSDDIGPVRKYGNYNVTS